MDLSYRDVKDEFFFWVAVGNIDALTEFYNSKKWKVMKEDKCFYYAIFMALRSNNLSLLKWLCEHGAKLDVTMTIGDNPTQTPIGWAQFHKNIEMEEYINSKKLIHHHP